MIWYLSLFAAEAYLVYGFVQWRRVKSHYDQWAGQMISRHRQWDALLHVAGKLTGKDHVEIVELSLKWMAENQA